MVRFASSRQLGERTERVSRSSRLPAKSLIARPTRTSEIPRSQGFKISKSRVKQSSSLLNKGIRTKPREISRKSVRFDVVEESQDAGKSSASVLGSIENFSNDMKSFSNTSQVGDDFVFEADPDALASILNNEGVSNGLLRKSQADECLLADGRPSLCRRIPINRTSSIMPDGARGSLISSRVSAGPGRIARPSVTGRPSMTGRPSVTGRQSFSVRRGSVIHPPARDSLYSFIERRYSQRHQDASTQPTAPPVRHSILFSHAKSNQQKSVKFEDPTFKKPDQELLMSARRVLSVKKSQSSAGSPALRQVVSPGQSSPALRVRRSVRRTPGKCQLTDKFDENSPDMKENIVTALNFQEDEENQSPNINQSTKSGSSKPRKSISRLKPVLQVTKRQSFLKKPSEKTKSGIPPNTGKRLIPPRNSDRYSFGKKALSTNPKVKEEMKTHYVTAELSKGEELIQPKVLNTEIPGVTLQPDEVAKSCPVTDNLPESMAENLPKPTPLANNHPAQTLEICKPKTLNAPKHLIRPSTRQGKPGPKIPIFGAKPNAQGADAEAVFGLMRNKLSKIKRRSVLASVLTTIEKTLDAATDDTVNVKLVRSEIPQLNDNRTPEEKKVSHPSALSRAKLPLPSGRSFLPKPQLKPWKEVLEMESTSPTWRDILKKEKSPSPQLIETANQKPYEPSAPDNIAFWTEKTPCPQKHLKVPSASLQHTVAQAQANSVLSDKNIPLATKCLDHEKEIKQAAAETKRIEEEMRMLQLERETLQKQQKQEQNMKMLTAPTPTLYKKNLGMSDMSATKERIMKVVTSKIPESSKLAPSRLNFGPKKFFEPIISPEEKQALQNPQNNHQLSKLIPPQSQVDAASIDYQNTIGTSKLDAATENQVKERKFTGIPVPKSVTWAESTIKITEQDEKPQESKFPPKDSPNFMKPKSADTMKWDKPRIQKEQKISSGRIGSKYQSSRGHETRPRVSEKCPIMPVISPKMDSHKGKNSPILKEKITPSEEKVSPQSIHDVFSDSQSPKWDPTFAELVKSPQFRASIKSSCSSDGFLSLTHIPDGTLLGPSFYEKCGITKEESVRAVKEEFLGKKWDYPKSPTFNPTENEGKLNFMYKFDSQSNKNPAPSPNLHSDVKNLDGPEVFSPRPHPALKNIDNMDGITSGKSPQIASPQLNTNFKDMRHSEMIKIPDFNSEGNFGVSDLELSALQSLHIVSVDFKKIPEHSDSNCNTSHLAGNELAAPGKNLANQKSVGLHDKPARYERQFDFSRCKSTDENGNFTSPIESDGEDKNENKNFSFGEYIKETKNSSLEEHGENNKETTESSSAEKMDSLALLYEGLSKGATGPVRNVLDLTIHDEKAPNLEPTINQEVLAGYSSVPLSPIPSGGRNVKPSRSERNQSATAAGLLQPFAHTDLTGFSSLTMPSGGNNDEPLQSERNASASATDFPRPSTFAQNTMAAFPSENKTDDVSRSIRKPSTTSMDLLQMSTLVTGTSILKPSIGFSSSTSKARPTPIKEKTPALPLPDFGQFKPSPKPAVLPRNAIKATRHPSDLINFSMGPESAGVLPMKGQVFTFSEPGITSSVLAAPKPIKPPPPETPAVFRKLRQKFRESPTPKKSRSRSPFSIQSPSRCIRKTPQKKSKILTSSPSIKTLCTKRFADALLDEEVALFNCRNFRNGPVTPSKGLLKESASNPLGRVLMEGDDMHFIPVSPIAIERSSKKSDAISGSAFSAFKQGT